MLFPTRFKRKTRTLAESRRLRRPCRDCPNDTDGKSAHCTACKQKSNRGHVPYTVPTFEQFERLSRG